MSTVEGGRRVPICAECAALCRDRLTRVTSFFRGQGESADLGDGSAI
jgi:hypothetical protein